PRYRDSNTLTRSEPAPKSKTPSGRPEPPQKEKSSSPRQKAANQKPIQFTLHAPQAKSVLVAGTFNNWDPQKSRLQRDGDGWKANISLAPGRYEYRFVVDGEWITDPNCKETVRNDYGSTNAVLVV